MKRSPKAHRRFTDNEARGHDRIRMELRESGVDTLLAFANQTERPWSATWAGWSRIAGEPFSEDAADNCQSNLRTWLCRLIAGRLTFSGVRVTIGYSFMKGRLDAGGPQTDLSEYLDWLFCEAIRSGEAQRIRQCHWPACGQFHTRKSPYCKRQHRDRHQKDLPARHRAYMRAYQARHRGKSRARESASAKSPTI